MLQCESGWRVSVSPASPRPALLLLPLQIAAKLAERNAAADAVAASGSGGRGGGEAGEALQRRLAGLRWVVGELQASLAAVDAAEAVEGLDGGKWVRRVIRGDMVGWAAR